MDIRTPGIHTERTATPRQVLLTQEGAITLPRGRILDGSLSRDPLNTGDLSTLRAGMILGMHTGNLWRPAILGLVTGGATVGTDYNSGETQLLVSAATAVEIIRRVGSSGVLNLTHAPTAGGTVVPYATLTYSAITTAGVMTITNIGADVICGSIVGPTVASDLSYVPRAILADPYGVKVTDEDAVDIDPPAKTLLVGGLVDVNQILNYPAAANTTLITWLQGVLNTYGKFVFSDRFQN